MNLGRLYEIYRARCNVQSSAPDCFPHYPPFNVVWEPHKYFGFASPLWSDDWHEVWHEGDPKLLASVLEWVKLT
jgi:hypothetical protein